MQLFDIVLNNTGTSGWLTSADELQIVIQSDKLNTVQPAIVKRLRPGDSAVVEVGVQNAAGVELGAIGPSIAVAQWSNDQSASLEFNATYGIPSYSATPGSVNVHESPDWFRGAKYGIFIHWGVYSVPAYGNTNNNESYAEWYWNHQMNPNDKTMTYQYHLNKYGANFLYDDFIANFTVENWNPKDWVDLFADAGARYFVPTTKHHEGFALFNMPSNVSNRNSVQQVPYRDLIKELFEAAKTYQPELRRGTYFSLPEWYNPAYSNYSDGTFGMGPPRNPYTNEVVPYTGFVEVDDFLTGIQLPQMSILAYDYETDIMWCDIGGPSLSDEFAAPWLNYALQQNRQVTFNDRCGQVNGVQIVGDYATPEYASTTKLSPKHWEACRGMDPFSFGYNYQTPDSEYMNATAIVTTLVDIVSKNGNFLLDIGPRSDGIIADIMQTNLRVAGQWIKAHHESIFDTKYWPNGPGSGNFRYTVTDDSFYIHYLAKPNGLLKVPDAVPYLSGDNVTVVGGFKDGSVVDSELDGDNLVLDIPDNIASADNYTWTFKITY
ncbi:glycoside hydrolase, family 29 [Talaromyces proteolyticus]|uniref:alpha-L-fucosidase n=1 Tax=Talaromyces proteolyticus TaxID=1131652 RepID=A0AAD4PU30_9EURO|nr:glycoside hydrolase, family 29 [Talaromyces proteolyticus]KAH8691685.1 glycoside hydrolase, family 29 [Talaromyces proteolyticus]